MAFLQSWSSIRMNPNLLVLRSVSFALIILVGLLPHRTLAQGKLALYLDFDCKTPSQLQPSVSLPLSTCLAPVGAVSVAIQLLPKCNNGATASLIMYDDTSCARSSFSKTGSYTGWSDINNCFYRFISTSVPAVMFTCEKPANNPQPTSTSTVSASMIAGVATGDVGGPTAAATSLPGTGSNSLPTNGSDGGGGDSLGSAGGSPLSGLSTSDRIALGVGLGVGIPSIVIALLTWCWPR